jgi:hypothetical protein
MLHKCTSINCLNNKESYTHNVVGGRAYPYPFKEEETPSGSQAAQWWMDQYEKTWEMGTAMGQISTYEDTEVEGDYEIVVSEPHMMVFTTSYYQVRKENDKEKLIFDPKGKPQTTKRPVSIKGCYDPECGVVQYYHSHDTADGTIIQYNPLDETIGGVTAKLISLDDKEEEWEQVEEQADDNSSTCLEDSICSTGESKLYVVTVTRNWIKIVTNYWRETKCEGCHEEIEPHNHITYDPNVVPRGLMNSTKISFCQNPDCTEAPALHAHTGGSSNKRIDIQVTEREAERL